MNESQSVFFNCIQDPNESKSLELGDGYRYDPSSDYRRKKFDDNSSNNLSLSLSCGDNEGSLNAFNPFACSAKNDQVYD